MATELRELRGLPEAIQKQFSAQQKRTTGKDDDVPEPLMTMSQWKAILESNKKASSLPPTPVKAGLFTTACDKIKATPRQILQSASPATVASISTALTVSTTRDEVLNALKLNLKVADDFNKLSLTCGYTVPVDTERVRKQAALNCSEKYFDDEEKHGLTMLDATMVEFSITSRSKKTNTMISEMHAKGLVTRGVNVSRDELGI